MRFWFLALVSHGCGAPAPETCALASTEAVPDTSQIADGASFAPADAHDRVLGGYTGLATWTDGSETAATLDLTEAGTTEFLRYEPEGCGPPYTTPVLLRLETEDGALDEEAETVLTIAGPDEAAVAAALSDPTGTLAPPEEYEDVLLGLQVVLVHDATGWAGTVSLIVQELEIDGGELEIDDNRVVMGTLSLPGPATR